MAPKLTDLEGKVALVTGATSGIGRAVAQALASAGAHVVISGRSEAGGAEVLAEISTFGGRARFVRADVAVEADVRHLVAQAVSAFGRLDLACNSAGIGIPGPITDAEEIDYRRLFDTNLWGVAVSMKYEIAAMIESGAGSIVNVSSIAGRIGVGRAPLYTASKHAVEGITKAVALDYARRNIRVNAVAPAYIATPMVERMVGPSGDQRDDLASQHPIGRLGRPDEIAAAVMFLLSDASSFITGESLMVDGGWIAQ